VSESSVLPTELTVSQFKIKSFLIEIKFYSFKFRLLEELNPVSFSRRCFFVFIRVIFTVGVIRIRVIRLG
jgi:hypothetical protein